MVSKFQCVGANLRSHLCTIDYLKYSDSKQIFVDISVVLSVLVSHKSVFTKCLSVCMSKCNAGEKSTRSTFTKFVTNLSTGSV